MDRKIVNLAITMMLIALLITGAGVLRGTRETGALEIIGEELGLKVDFDDEYVPTDNLNPGDTKSSKLIITNTGEAASSLPIYLKADIIESRPGLGGGRLDDQLEATLIDSDNNVLFSGTVGDLEQAVMAGTVNKDEPKEITFAVHLPGRTTTNEFQSADLSFKLIIIAEAVPDEEEEEPTPGPSDGPGTTEEPGDDPPKTGDDRSYLVYIGAALLSVAGLFIILKFKKQQ